jgi:hypothetical protein
MEAVGRYSLLFHINEASRPGLLICIKCLGLLIRILTAHIIGAQ